MCKQLEEVAISIFLPLSAGKHSSGLLFSLVLMQESFLPRSKYEEDVYINNHTSVWGSWWKDHQWGYKCCEQTIKNSYCTGAAGIEAAEAAVDLMKANVAPKAASEGMDFYKFI